jgi:hypothetical protein
MRQRISFRIDFYVRQRGGRSVFIGLDVHKESWQVSVRAEEEEIFHGRLPSEYPALDRPIARLPRCTIKVAYEAGLCEF